jgi:hypothetical protein
LRRAEAGTEKRRPSWLEFFLARGSMATKIQRCHDARLQTSIDEIVALVNHKRIKRLRDTRQQDGRNRQSANRSGARESDRETADASPSDATLWELVLAEIDNQPWSLVAAFNDKRDR